jgi:diguanylate cyclase (GGDEF)-like protein
MTMSHPVHDPIEHLLAQAESARAAGGLAAGLDAATQAWSALPEADMARRRRAGLLRTHFLYRSGRLHDLVAVGLEVLPLLRAEGPATELIDVLRLVALCACDSNRLEVAQLCAQEAHRLALGLGDVGRLSLAVNTMGCFFERTGDPWQAERLLHEALTLAQTQTESHPKFVALNNLSAVLIGSYHLLRDAVDIEEAREPLRRALPCAREAVVLGVKAGEPFHKVFALGNLGEILVNLGLADEAEPNLTQAHDEALRGGFDAQRWRVAVAWGEWHLLRGQPQAAWDVLASALHDSTASGVHMTHLRLHHTLWRAARDLGHPADALAHLQAYLQLERLRTVKQQRAQSELFVTRLEAEQMRTEAHRHRTLARELEADVRRDPLTGLGNRRELERRWPQLLAQAADHDTPLAVAMLDLDGFKQVNDARGHAVGDRVLVALAGLLRAHTRNADLVARMGGEEFLLALPDTSPERAQEVCERLREQVAGYDWHALAPGLQVTISAGLACAPPGAPDTLIEAADAALYRAKSAGRNRVMRA